MLSKGLQRLQMRQASKGDLQLRRKSCFPRPKCTYKFSRAFKNNIVDKGFQINHYFKIAKLREYFRWFDLFINDLLPLLTAEEKLFRENVKHNSIAGSTFLRYLKLFMEPIKKRFFPTDLPSFWMVEKPTWENILLSPAVLQLILIMGTYFACCHFSHWGIKTILEPENTRNVWDTY